MLNLIYFFQSQSIWGKCAFNVTVQCINCMFVFGFFTHIKILGINPPTMLVVEHQPAFVQHQAEAVVPLAFCMEQHPRAPHGFKLERDDVLFWPFWPRSQLVDQGGAAIKTGHIRSYRQKNLLLMTIMYHWGVWEPNQAAVSKVKRSLFFCVYMSVCFNICFLCNFWFRTILMHTSDYMQTYYIDIHTSQVWVQSSQWGSRRGESSEDSERSQGVLVYTGPQCRHYCCLEKPKMIEKHVSLPHF